VELEFDSLPAGRYRSRSQIARVASQAWIKRELPCLKCSSAPLSATAENTKSRDFVCGKCHEPYELKSKDGHFTRWVLNGEYSTLLETIRSGRTPNLLLLEYDRSQLSVIRLQAIHRSLLSPLAIKRRKPLSESARRAGWQGCNIDLSIVPAVARIPIVWNGRILPWSGVVGAWSRFDFMVRVRPESRGWLRDVLSCIQTLPDTTFTLRDLYQFEGTLAQQHTGNQNIRPKIRQQLQVLTAKGALRRVRPGVYTKAAVSGPTLDDWPNDRLDSYL
jgi:type II restriction enzyme